MSEFEEGLDPELRAEFIDESLDGLSDVTELIVQLEDDPSDMDVVQSIFRPIHSIKGNAAYFGLMNTKTLAHELETILDLVRQSTLHPTSFVIDILLRGVDELATMLGRARGEEPEVSDPEAFDDLINTVVSAATAGLADEEALWKKLLATLADSTGASLDLAEQLASFSAAGQVVIGADDEGATDEEGIPEPASRLSELLRSEDIVVEAEEIQSLFDEMKTLTKSSDAEAIIDSALSEIDLFTTTFGLDDPIAREALLDRVDEVVQLGAWVVTAQESTLASEDDQESGKVGGGAAKSSTVDENKKVVGKTMRIPEESIDAFLAHVGDLVTIGEMYRHLQARLSGGGRGQDVAGELRRINESFGDLSRALQHSIMKIRKVQLNAILQRVPRIVRDIASSSGKQIETRVEGGEILADKSLVDTLEAPLIHMTRNAADHGIETSEVRQAQGKDATGVIAISASETADQIVLSIKDDGKGLDYKALTLKAVSLGLVSEGSELTENDLVELLFQSGVSTAEEVTDVSGRGVGMDVVKRSIEEIGGRISITSVSGEGSEFVVHLPRTVATQIIGGFVVVIGDDRYVLPMDRIVRCFRPEETDIVTVAGRGECVRNGDEFIKVCRLGEVFGLPQQAIGHLGDGILVVVEVGNTSLAFYVDDIEGMKQVVFKDVEGLEKEGSWFTGAAVMGDGAVAMIVDLERFEEVAN